MTDGKDRTFLFADLSGYTAMTESHGDDDAAAIAIRFAEVATAALVGDASIVKTIGDAVMVTSTAPREAVQTAVALAQATAAEPLFPLVRMGLHHGPCVQRGADYFGATVNLAARVAAHARAGQILVTGSVATALAGASFVTLRDAGLGHFKNVSAPIPLFEISAQAPEAQPGRDDTIDPAIQPVVDPVCRMRVDPALAPVRVIHAGEPYCFCSEACAKTFLDAPAKHVAAFRR